MIEEKKKMVLLAFGAIYLIMGGMLAYLIFFNIGLEIEERFDAEEGEKIVLFKNTSSRIIKGVVISYKDELGKTHELQEIGTVQPSEEVKLNLQVVGNQQEITLIAEAPFHQTIEKKIILKASSTGLAYQLNFPSIVIANSSLVFEFDICNNLQIERNVEIEETHDQQFFSEENSNQTITLRPNDCTKVDYNLMPLKEGTTTILFNVKVANNTEKLEKILNITG